MGGAATPWTGPPPEPPESHWGLRRSFKWSVPLASPTFCVPQYFDLLLGPPGCSWAFALTMPSPPLPPPGTRLPVTCCPRVPASQGAESRVVSAVALVNTCERMRHHLCDDSLELWV